MLGGPAILAVLTGAITSAFVIRTQEAGQKVSDEAMLHRLDELRSQLEAIRSDLDRGRR